jgi:hypothetical protein
VRLDTLGAAGDHGDVDDVGEALGIELSGSLVSAAVASVGARTTFEVGLTGSAMNRGRNSSSWMGGRARLERRKCGATCC